MCMASTDLPAPWGPTIAKLVDVHRSGKPMPPRTSPGSCVLMRNIPSIDGMPVRMTHLGPCSGTGPGAGFVMNPPGDGGSGTLERHSPRRSHSMLLRLSSGMPRRYVRDSTAYARPYDPRG